MRRAIEAWLVIRWRSKTIRRSRAVRRWDQPIEEAAALIPSRLDDQAAPTRSNLWSGEFRFWRSGGSLPEMAAGELPAGSSLEVLLELPRGWFLVELDDHQESPRTVPSGVRREARIVSAQSACRVRRQPDIVLGRAIDALEDVNEPLRLRHARQRARARVTSPTTKCFRITRSGSDLCEKRPCSGGGEWAKNCRLARLASRSFVRGGVARLRIRRRRRVAPRRRTAPAGSLRLHS